MKAVVLPPPPSLLVRRYKAEYRPSDLLCPVTKVYVHTWHSVAAPASAPAPAWLAAELRVRDAAGCRCPLPASANAVRPLPQVHPECLVTC